MPAKNSSDEKTSLADWLIRGALTRIGDNFDRFSGRRSVSASSLATSELIARLTKLLDLEAREVAGKGTVVPHRIELRMQWDKFVDDSDEKLKRLGTELTVAMIDHINDSRYYTYAPINLKVKPDYFVEGVKLVASFDKLVDEENEAILNVTMPFIGIDQIDDASESESGEGRVLILTFTVGAVETQKKLEVSPDKRISVGREASNELVIDDASVSKIHASLIMAGDGKFMVADTGSTNGTFVNDVRIPYGKAVMVENTDRLKFGNVEVRFDLEPDSNETPETEIENIDDVGNGESDRKTISAVETVSFEKAPVLTTKGDPQDTE